MSDETPTADYRDRLCRDCRHWQRRSADPHNLGGSVLGTCRERLHVPLVLTEQGVVVGPPVYAQVPAGFPACAHFAPADAPATEPVPGAAGVN